MNKEKRQILIDQIKQLFEENELTFKEIDDLLSWLQEHIRVNMSNSKFYNPK